MLASVSVPHILNGMMEYGYSKQLEALYCRSVQTNTGKMFKAINALQ
jgi:hypothetical protein